ncbi:MAG: hypothetical protein JSW65_07610 [Candidatus Bipolaricaulota bacterium]|nr:MAG: hypothetical protein JSW65_07610 [Candidatus Bipolaricaulota bacterium]
MSGPEFDEQKAHQHFAGSCFNAAWELIDKSGRTPAEDEEMLRMAMASSWHWTQRKDCTPQNLSIAYWQVSRVHALCGRGDEARRYGELCLEVSQREGIDPFALGYAYEALARAESIAGKEDRKKEWLVKANEVAESIADDDTKKMLCDDLATIA